MKYYVYVLMNPLKNFNLKIGKFEFKNEPFYVGKGKCGTNLHNAHFKFQGNNLLKHNKIKKIIQHNAIPEVQILRY